MASGSDCAWLNLYPVRNFEPLGNSQGVPLIPYTPHGIDLGTRGHQIGDQVVWRGTRWELDISIRTENYRRKQ
jgi:hypothetical protein